MAPAPAWREAEGGRAGVTTWNSRARSRAPEEESIAAAEPNAIARRAVAAVAREFSDIGGRSASR